MTDNPDQKTRLDGEPVGLSGTRLPDNRAAFRAKVQDLSGHEAARIGGSPEPITPDPAPPVQPQFDPALDDEGGGLPLTLLLDSTWTARIDTKAGSGKPSVNYGLAQPDQELSATTLDASALPVGGRLTIPDYTRYKIPPHWGSGKALAVAPVYRRWLDGWLRYTDGELMISCYGKVAKRHYANPDYPNDLVVLEMLARHKVRGIGRVWVAFPVGALTTANSRQMKAAASQLHLKAPLRRDESLEALSGRYANDDSGYAVARRNRRLSSRQAKKPLDQQWLEKQILGE